MLRSKSKSFVYLFFHLLECTEHRYLDVTPATLSIINTILRSSRHPVFRTPYFQGPPRRLLQYMNVHWHWQEYSTPLISALGSKGWTSSHPPDLTDKSTVRGGETGWCYGTFSGSIGAAGHYTLAVGGDAQPTCQLEGQHRAMMAASGGMFDASGT